MITFKRFTLITLMAATVATTSNTYAMQPDERPKRQRDERGEDRRTDRPRIEPEAPAALPIAIPAPAPLPIAAPAPVNHFEQLPCEILLSTLFDAAPYQPARSTFARLIELKRVNVLWRSLLTPIIPTPTEMAGLANPANYAYRLGLDDDGLTVAAALDKLASLPLIKAPLHFGPRGSAAHYAVAFNNPNTLNALVRSNPLYLSIMDGDNKTPLHLALEQHATMCIEAITNTIIDNQREKLEALNYTRGLTPEAIAAQTAIINAEISFGEQIKCAAELGNFDAALSQLQQRDIPENAKDADGETALIRAAHANNLPEVQRLLTIPGINVNTQNNSGETALLEAAKNDHLTMVQTLIAAGANVNVKDNAGWTALHWAAGHGHLAVVQALITAGANINTREDINGQSALHLTANLDRPAVVCALIAAGANVNTKNNNGSTALHGAASDDQLTMVQALLAAPGMTRKTVEAALNHAHPNREIHGVLRNYLKKHPAPEAHTSRCGIQ